MLDIIVDNIIIWCMLLLYVDINLYILGRVHRDSLVFLCNNEFFWWSLSCWISLNFLLQTRHILIMFFYCLISSLSFIRSFCLVVRWWLLRWLGWTWCLSLWMECLKFFSRSSLWRYFWFLCSSLGCSFILINRYYNDETIKDE